jgi:glycine cleavage system H protein
MSEFLEFSSGKFIFHIAADCLYTPEGVWARVQGDTIRVGLSDYLQQRSGDVAFVEIKSAGIQLSAGDEFAVIETIKVDLSLGAPVSGELLAANPALEAAAEAINQDPYGAGWMAEIRPLDWERESAALLSPVAYLAKAQAEADQETRRQ